MKASTIGALLATALIAAGGAYAAPQSEQGSDVVRVSTTKTMYRHSSGELANYASTYRLSNGQTVRFTQYGQHFYAELKGEARSRMYGQEPGVFLTDTGARIEFAEDGETLAIGNFERLAPMARLDRDTVMYASR